MNEDQYSPQSIVTRMWQLDLQIENIKVIVKTQAKALHDLDKHLEEVHREVKACAARHAKDA